MNDTETSSEFIRQPRRDLQLEILISLPCVSAPLREYFFPLEQVKGYTYHIGEEAEEDKITLGTA